MTEEELAIALESLPSINAVSVARSPCGLEHVFTWTVTISSAYMTADGSVELLKSNSSELAGFAAITTPAMVIPAENFSSEVVCAYILSTQPSNQLFPPSINVQTISREIGQPRIFKIHSQATTHFDEEILITMSNSMADNEQSFFPLSFRILSITTLTAMLLFLSALYLWMQWLKYRKNSQGRFLRNRKFKVL